MGGLGGTQLLPEDTLGRAMRREAQLLQLGPTSPSLPGMAPSTGPSCQALPPRPREHAQPLALLPRRPLLAQPGPAHPRHDQLGLLVGSSPGGSRGSG